ncbi:MAG: hypothetical protein ACREIM_05975, partial [Nitrospiraceae bacterium]
VFPDPDTPIRMMIMSLFSQDCPVRCLVLLSALVREMFRGRYVLSTGGLRAPVATALASGKGGAEQPS